MMWPGISRPGVFSDIKPKKFSSIEEEKTFIKILFRPDLITITVENPADLQGVVIIDEFGLHMHARWQKKFPSLLSNVFPKIQFIVTTHSVLPIVGAPKNSVFLKVNRNKIPGITIEKLKFKTENLLANAILTSPLFDLELEDIMQKPNPSIRDLITEDIYKEIMENEKLKEQLKALEKNNSVEELIQELLDNPS